MKTKQIDLRLGDCLEVLKTIEDNSIDSIVTDPPYGLSFMNKHWDYEVPSVAIWQECLRVLKPGGHLLSFGGSRTYHRMACAIEDAGFEIRDQIMWIYASGFPKSHNISKSLIKLADEKERTEQNTEHNLRCVPDSYLQETELINEEQGQTLLNGLSEQDLSSSRNTTSIIRSKESILEGRNNLQETEGELQGSEIHQMSEGVYADGEKRRIHNGTQISNGTTSQEITNENGSSTSYKPQSIKQQNRKSNVVSEQFTSQEIREIGEKFNNFGTSLKPAHEPIVVARKPISEKSIAENVLKWRTGGLNIDESRIKHNEPIKVMKAQEGGNKVFGQGGRYEETTELKEEGRWPANIIFDEEAGKLLDEQSGITTTRADINYGWDNTECEGNTFKGRGKYTPRNDKGGASRFFYCAKTSKKERNEGIDNNHPTVKPITLMSYLIKLVTPPNGIVLDPFMGSGSTGKAAIKENFNFIGIEREQEYFDIAKARIEYEYNKHHTT